MSSVKWRPFWFRIRLVAWSFSSHYLNQFWNVVNLPLNKNLWNLVRNSCILIQGNAFDLKMSGKRQQFCLGLNVLTHWGRVTHICVSKLTVIGSDNGLSPDRRQAINWTNAGILLIRTIGTNFSEILSEIHTFSLKKMHFKMSSAKWRPFCLGLNVLMVCYVLALKLQLTHCALVMLYGDIELGQHWLR